MGAPPYRHSLQIPTIASQGLATSVLGYIKSRAYDDPRSTQGSIFNNKISNFWWLCFLCHNREDYRS